MFFRVLLVGFSLFGPGAARAYRNYISYFYKVVNKYYNIYKPITARQVNYKVN